MKPKVNDSQENNRPMKGLRMTHLVAQRQGQRAPQGERTSYTPLDLNESKRSFSIQSYLRGVAFRGEDKQRVVLPTDGKTQAQVQKSQAERERDFRHVSAMGRYSRFMPSSAYRLNNPSQAAMVKQRQRVGPNSNRQFQAFMNAMAAAFGTLQQ